MAVDADRTEATRALAREAFLRHVAGTDWTDLDLLSPELELSTHVRPEPFRGHAGFREFMGIVRTAFPDAEFTIEDIVAEGDTAAIRWTMRATHGGSANGIPATHRPVELHALELFELGADGKVRYAVLKLNSVEIMRQLGVFPERLPAPLRWLTAQRLRRQRRRELGS
jgi:steroid delta-isomerase-like uncharacterized protein